jgi:hypothetical protein
MLTVKKQNNYHRKLGNILAPFGMKSMEIAVGEECDILYSIYYLVPLDLIVCNDGILI